MIEIRIHGRGGMGAVTSSQILATAAFYDKKYSQAFPMFGVERGGAPVMALTRIDTKPIHLRSQVYNPDYVIVLDPTLLKVVDVKQGLKKDLIINTNKKIKGAKCIDATSIALKKTKKPYVNIIMVGAFAAFTKIISLKAILKAIEIKFKDKELIKQNQEAVKNIYNEIMSNM